MSILIRRATVAALLLAWAPVAWSQADTERQHEPNTRVPAGVMRYASTGFPDRIVASPAADAASGFSVAWRTNAMVEAPLLEIVVAGDSPDMGLPRQLRATTRLL